MATMKFLRGLQANLDGLNKYEDGALYFTTDTHKIFMGTGETSIQEFSAIEVVASVSALPTVDKAIKGKFYYAEAENVFCFNFNGEWKQVNPDTGATSIEVIGAGNAVTNASYDAATRKITLTKGETFATKAELDELDDYVGDIPTDEKYADIDTVIGYINKKAEETLAAASGNSTETAASVKAALDTYKTENDAAVKANADAIDAIEADYLKAADKTELQGKIDEKAAQTALDDAEDRIEALENANKEGGDVAKAIGAAQTAADAAQDAVDALAEKVGEVPTDKTVVQMIADAQTAATYDDTKVKADIQANADAIAEEKARMDAFMALGESETLNAALDSLKELQDFITAEAGDADVLLGKVSALEGIVAGIGGDKDEHKTVVAYVTAAIDALKIGDYAKAQDLIDLAERVKAMEDKVADWDDAVAKEHEHANKTVLDGITAEKVAAWDSAQANAEATVAEALAGAVETLEGNIETATGAVQDALDDYKKANDAEVAKKANSADVYAKTETYTQTEVDAEIASAVEAAITWGTF